MIVELYTKSFTIYDTIMSVSNESSQEYGTCCFCFEPCNISSQSCGRCSRQIDMTLMCGYSPKSGKVEDSFRKIKYSGMDRNTIIQRVEELERILTSTERSRKKYKRKYKRCKNIKTVKDGVQKKFKN